ncbi:MAG TPA: TOMM precursor leader peptide-binding protein [Bryobacteraceae bacterium]|nr:TOMM precursor leader peptide-binding protein [Bryobacteraceae bacterium]
MSDTHVISAGPFGRAVARHLRQLLPGLGETPWDGETPPPPGGWPEVRVQILAAWRPVPALCDALDAASRARQIPFIPLVLDCTDMRLGPVILPEGPCWQCWVMRARQNVPSSRQEAALLRYYEDHPHAGPRGYLEPFAMMGAAQISQTVSACRQGSVTPGWIWQLNVFTGEIKTGRLIGLDGCPRCGLGRPAEGRTYVEVRERLAHLWATPDTANG